MALAQSLIKFVPLPLFMLYGFFLFLIPIDGYSVSANIPKRDSVLMAQIQTQIAANSMLAPLHIDLNISNGAVSLGGVMPGKREAKVLIILVESTAGVHSVDTSDLSLAKGKTLSSDDIINSLVIGTLNREGLMGPLSQRPSAVAITGPGNATYVVYPPPINIQVNTKDGVVYLSGTVPKQEAADKAVDLAQSVSGVEDVQSSLKVVSGR